MVSGPAQYGATAPTLRCTKGDGKPAVSRRMPGAGLSLWRSGKAPPNKPAFQPYWGKPAVRNERGDRGNVGIIRSPARASILPDCGGRSAMSVPTAILRDVGQPHGVGTLGHKGAAEQVRRHREVVAAVRGLGAASPTPLGPQTPVTPQPPPPASR